MSKALEHPPHRASAQGEYADQFLNIGETNRQLKRILGKTPRVESGVKVRDFAGTDRPAMFSHPGACSSQRAASVGRDRAGNVAVSAVKLEVAARLVNGEVDMR